MSIAPKKAEQKTKIVFMAEKGEKMTAQTLINILFLVILICHIIKLRYMQEQSKQLWHNIDLIAEAVQHLRETVREVQEDD